MSRKSLNDLKVLEDSYIISIGFLIEDRIRENFFKRSRAVLNENGEYYLMVKVNFSSYIPQL